MSSRWTVPTSPSSSTHMLVSRTTDVRVGLAVPAQAAETPQEDVEAAEAACHEEQAARDALALIEFRQAEQRRLLAQREEAETRVRKAAERRALISESREKARSRRRAPAGSDSLAPAGGGGAAVVQTGRSQPGGKWSSVGTVIVYRSIFYWIWRIVDFTIE